MGLNFRLNSFKENIIIYRSYYVDHFAIHCNCITIVIDVETTLVSRSCDVQIILFSEISHTLQV